MIRAAAKNHSHVAVVVDPNDYAELLTNLAAGSDTPEAVQYRKRLAWKAFQHCATYDSTVAEWLWSQIGTSSQTCHALLCFLTVNNMSAQCLSGDVMSTFNECRADAASLCHIMSAGLLFVYQAAAYRCCAFQYCTFHCTSHGARPLSRSCKKAPVVSPAETCLSCSQGKHSRFHQQNLTETLRVTSSFLDLHVGQKGFLLGHNTLHMHHVSQLRFA